MGSSWCIWLYLHKAQICFLDYAFQDNLHKLVENPILWHKFFQKFHLSIPSIRLVLHVLRVQHHERNFSSISSFSSSIQFSGMSHDSWSPFGISMQVLTSSHCWRTCTNKFSIIHLISTISISWSWFPLPPTTSTMINHSLTLQPLTQIWTSRLRSRIFHSDTTWCSKNLDLV